MKRIDALFLLAVLAAGSPAAGQTTELPHPGKIFGTDERVPVNDPAVARIVPVGCTGWMISNGAFLTAGHCVTKYVSPVTCPTVISPEFATVQFNVPLSQDDGTINDPSQRDQYPILSANIRCEYVVGDTISRCGTGGSNFRKDWAVFAVGTNAFGQNPIENQKAFYRVTDLSGFPPADTSRVRVTGYGVDGPPPDYGKGGDMDRYSQTEQTAAGQYLGLFSEGGCINLRYTTDTNQGNSGGPAVLDGSTLALGIHDGGAASVGYNYATSFGLSSLADALQAFPGLQVNPVIPGASIFYVDAFSPAYVAAPTGHVFAPYPALTEALKKVAALPAGTASMISVVTGGYPETIDQATATTVDITVTLNGDLTLVTPVGDVTLWGTVQVPTSGSTTG